MNINKHIFLTLLIIGSYGSYAQQNTPENHQSERWKWQSEYAELNIKLGDDSLALPPEQELLGSAWWKAFGYAELNRLTELALEENNSLKMASNNVEASRARVKYTRSFLYPSVSFNPSVMRQEYSANRPMPFDVGDVQSVTINSYTLPLDLSYEVDITGKLSNSAKASTYQLQASDASQESVKLSVAAQVARQFVMLLMLDAEKAILERTLSTRRENLEIVEDRYEAGLTNEIDYQRAKTEYSSVSVQLKNNQLQRTDVELMLATLCGQSASSFSIEHTDLLYLAPEIADYLPERSNVTHPDIKAAEYEVESFKTELKSARKDMYPSLYLDGSLGLLSGQTENIFESESRNWMVGATLSVPLFEGGRRKAQTSISKYQLQSAMDQLNEEKLRADREVEKAFSNLARINEQLAVQQEFLSAAQKAAELSQQRYRKGLVTYLEVVDAERVVLEAERLLTQLLGQQLISTIDLIEATGGKFDRL